MPECPCALVISSAQMLLAAVDVFAPLDGAGGAIACPFCQLLLLAFTQVSRLLHHCFAATRAVPYDRVHHRILCKSAVQAAVINLFIIPAAHLYTTIFHSLVNLFYYSRL